MAERPEIIDTLESLAVHCRLPLMDVDSRSRWMASWCEDLAEFPIGAIEDACREWRRSGATKFPTPGQLLPLVRTRATVGHGGQSQENNQAWTWPTDDQLAAMTLRERRRAYLIMATETRSKAGPMDREGKIPRPQFVEQAKAYTEEAARLSTILASFKDAAE